MPLGPNVRYRQTKGGVRLAFRGDKVLEAKNMRTGATSELIHDRKRQARRRRPKLDTNSPVMV